MATSCRSVASLVTCVWLSASGCATLFSSSAQTITITSNVDGAEVLLNGTPVGRTPLNHSLDRATFDEFTVTLRHPAYESRDFRIGKTLNTTALFNCTSWPSWLTDATTGAMMEYSPSKYYMEMKPRTPAATAAGDRRIAVMRFVVMQHAGILEDVARGGGERVSALAELLDLDPAETAELVARLRDALPAMVREVYPHHLTTHIEATRAGMKARASAAPDS